MWVCYTIMPIQFIRKPSYNLVSLTLSLDLVVRHTLTHTHPFNGPFSETTQVSRYPKGITNLDFNEARDR